eukprot:scaffold16255_cov75-Skeletonema_dohrnii-CCMP3373.AAC.2
MSSMKKFQASRDMFLRLCNVSIAADKVFQGWVVHLKGAGVFYTFDTIEDFQSCNAGLTLSCFLPDTKSFANQRRAANAAIDARMNEEFMGENPEKLSKLPTTALVQVNFSSLRALLVVVANLSLIASVFVKFDATTNPADAPLLHALGFQIGDCLHDKKFNDWFFLQVERVRMAFLYWLFSTTNGILQAILQLGANETHIQAILLHSPELIDGAEWFAIEDDIAQAEASIVNFVKGTAPVPENNLFLSSDYCVKAEEKKQAQLLAALHLKSPGLSTPGRPSPNKRKTPAPPTEDEGSQVTRKEGELRWDASKAKGLGWHIPPPPHVPGLRSLCLMHVVESKGCLNKACQFLHPMKFSEWDKRAVALWDKHVKDTPGLSWHPNIVAEVGKLNLVVFYSRPPRPQHYSSPPGVSPLARTQAVLAKRLRQTKLSSSVKVKVTHMPKSIPKLPSARKRTQVKLAAPTPRPAVQQQLQPFHSASPSNLLLAEYNLRHFGIPADGPSSLTGKFVRPSSFPSSSLYNALLGISEGSSTPSWRLHLPSHAALLRTPFGRPSLNHSFTQEASFDTIIFSVFKYGVGFLTESDFDALCSVNVLLHHFATMIVALHAVDFRALREPDPNWSLCQSIPRLKELDFLALLFHYDLHLSAAVRFLGPKYLGGHRNISQICAKLAPHIDAETIAHYKRIMTVGCPNRFTASTTRANSELYRLQGNDSSILRHQSLVKKNMLKEYKHNFAFPLPVWMGRYLRHSFFTPQHIHLHPSKPPRQIFNAKARPTPDAVAVNNMTSTPFGSELECRYGDVLSRLFRRLWNLRITYPDKDIVYHCNDVKSCFRQIDHHPDVVGAFSFVVFQHVWIQIGCTFGSDFSPANWEGIRRTIEQLARGLFDDASLRTKHRKYLDQLQWDVSLDSPNAKHFVPAVADSQNSGVSDENGCPVSTPHDMFVDDLVYAEVYLRERVEQAIAASIEAMFITLGESDLLRRQDPISWCPNLLYTK